MAMFSKSMKSAIVLLLGVLAVNCFLGFSGFASLWQRLSWFM